MRQPIFTTCIFLFFIGIKNINASPFLLKNTTSIDTIKKDLKWFNNKDTIAFAPICGVDGRTYLNSDEAAFYGINRWSAGSCYEYTEVISVDPEFTWISEVMVNQLSQTSKYTKQGYTKFTNVIFDIYKNKANQFSFTNNSLYPDNQQVVKVWIDYNSNGKFENDEIVIHQSIAKNKTQHQFSIPSYLETEFMTRMRIFYGLESEQPESGYIETGEVEDYTVMVMD